MELRHLRYVVAVADAGGFVKAAAALHVAQPALSRQVRDLERELGVVLFERKRGGATLTRQGLRFVNDARRLLYGAERAVIRVRAAGRVGALSFNVGYGELLAHWPKVSEVLHQFRLAHPDVPLMAMEMGRPEMEAGLREDRTDVVITGMVHWPPRGFDGMRLSRAFQTGVLVAAEHPLAAKKTIRLADLRPLRWLHLRPDATWDVYPEMRARLRKAGLSLGRNVVRPAGYAFVPQIAAGEGWSFADEAMARDVAGVAPSIAYRPLEDDPVEVWVTAVWKKGTSSAEVRSFAKIAEAAFPAK